MLKSRILFCLALVGAAALAIGYGDKQAGFTILYALLLLCAFCAISVILAPSFLTFEEQAANKVVFKNEVFSYGISIKNRGPFLYPGAVYRFYNAELLSFEGDESLGICEPFKTQNRKYEISFPYRGVYHLGLQSITVTDMLGLFSRTIHNKDPLDITVFPERDEGFAFRMRNEPQDSSMHQDIFNEDYSAVADLRKYNPADSLRKIHWKLSAKRGELIAKNFHSCEPDHTIQLLDTTKIDLPERERAKLEDKMVSYAASALDHCARAKMPATLVYGEPGKDEMPVSVSGEVDGFYSLLAGIRFEREKSPLYGMRNVSGTYKMMAFLSDIDDGVCAALKELVSFDHNLIIYLFLSESRPLTPKKEYLIEGVRAFGIGVHLVADDPPGGLTAQEGGAA